MYFFYKDIVNSLNVNSFLTENIQITAVFEDIGNHTL